MKKKTKDTDMFVRIARRVNRTVCSFGAKSEQESDIPHTPSGQIQAQQEMAQWKPRGHHIEL